MTQYRKQQLCPYTPLTFAIYCGDQSGLNLYSHINFPQNFTIQDVALEILNAGFKFDAQSFYLDWCEKQGTTNEYGGYFTDYSIHVANTKTSLVSLVPISETFESFVLRACVDDSLHAQLEL